MICHGIYLKVIIIEEMLVKTTLYENKKDPTLIWQDFNHIKHASSSLGVIACDHLKIR